MSGGGYGSYNPSAPGSPVGSNQSMSGSSASPWSAFGMPNSFGPASGFAPPAYTTGGNTPSGNFDPSLGSMGSMKSMGGSGFDPSSMGTTGGNMASGNFDPSMGASGGFNPYGFTTGGNMPGGNFDPNAYFSALSSQFMGSPFMPPYQQQPMQPQQPQAPGPQYYQPGQNLSTQSQMFDMSNSPDQIFLQRYNGQNGTNFSALSQLPANDYQNYLATGNKGV